MHSVMRLICQNSIPVRNNIIFSRTYTVLLHEVMQSYAIYLLCIPHSLIFYYPSNRRAKVPTSGDVKYHARAWEKMINVVWWDAKTDAPHPPQCNSCCSKDGRH